MAARQTTVLVTGATGFLGSRLVNGLVIEGYAVRALARKTSNVEGLKKCGVEIVTGDVVDKSSIVDSVKGIDVVVHAAAGTSGTAEDSESVTVQGTRNIIEVCRESCVKKLVYISSCNVYETAGYAENQVVTEEAQLERFPLCRGHYTAAKLEAENLVTEAMNHDGQPIVVVLRPGTLYGPGGEVYTKMIGITFEQKVFIVFGNGENELPLVHVDNVVDAIVECIRKSAADNQVFNVVDHDQVTKKMYMEQVVKPLYSRAVVLYCPMFVICALTWVQEKVLLLLGKAPVLTMYRLASSQKRVRYDTLEIQNAIGWRSRIRFAQGASQLIAHHQESVRS